MISRTLRVRTYVYLTYTGGLWAVQWLLFWATGGAVPEPSLVGLFILAVMSLFWFFIPLRPWFPSRRLRGGKD